MDLVAQIEAGLERALSDSLRRAPPRLAAAMRHAVFPGGARVRPRLCLAVALTGGADGRSLAMSAASAIELIHCASLVHDDLPCFDDATHRRGAASVHAAYGAPLAVLVGDALIVLAFETLARAATRDARAASLLLLLAAAAGPGSGLIAGQAMECEPNGTASASSGLSRYQRAKTASLFAAATMSGAICAGAPPDAWRRLGECLGEAYQVADDIRDVAGTLGELGKAPGRDLALGRPSAVAETGLAAALSRLHGLVDEAIASIPPGDHVRGLAALIEGELERLVPPALLDRAA